MTSAFVLDGLLESHCKFCKQRFWACECPAEPDFPADAPEDDVVMYVGSTWIHRDENNAAYLDAALRIWARYRRAQALQEP